MNFTAKLQSALELLEAKKMIGDDKKPFLEKNILGWQVLMYDDIHAETGHLYDKTKIRLPRIKEKLDLFLRDHYSKTTPDKLTAAIIQDALTDRKTLISWQVLNKIDTPLMDMIESDDGNEVASHVETVLNSIYDSVADMVKLTYADTLVFDVNKLNRFTVDVSETPIDNIINSTKDVIENLPERIDRVLGELADLLAEGYDQLDKDSPIVTSVLKMTEMVMSRIKALGIRKSAAVPIRFHFVNEFPLSGHGSSLKAGDETPGKYWRNSSKITTGLGQTTHNVNVYVTNHTTLYEAMNTLAHEIGHVLFSVDSSIQKIIARAANTNPSPSAYGSPSYVYPGLSEPITHHKSGNEWMAEMFAKLVTGDKKSMDYMPHQFSFFRYVISLINGHPHAGIVYRAGQDKPDWEIKKPSEEEDTTDRTNDKSKRRNAIRKNKERRYRNKPDAMR